MEQSHGGFKHGLRIDERKDGFVTGIQKVESFDTTLVVLATTQGRLTIKGKDLHVIRVDVERGELEFSGNVDSVIYSELHAVGKGAKGALKRMFR